MMTLTQQCLSLPMSERRMLAQELLKSISEGQKDSRGDDLLCVVESIIGTETSAACRKESFVWARAMVAHQLRSEGYTLVHIGEMLHKNNSTIYYLLNKMKDLLTYPNIYKQQIDIWNQFQGSIK